MGSIFRQQYTAPDPKHPGKRITKTSRKYYIQYTIGGRTKREPAYTDKAASLELLRRRESEIARGIVGLPSKSPFHEHIADYGRDLKNRGATPDYAAKTESRVREVCEAGEIETITHLTSDRINAALAGIAERRTTDRAAGKRVRQFGKSSRNHYLRAVKMFAKWLVDTRRAAHDSIRAMKFQPTDGFKTRERRPLTAEEFAKLLAAAAAGPVREGLTGEERVAVYVLAANTGYRRLELSTIAPASFTFGAEPAVGLAAKSSKRRREESIPIRADVAEFFARYLARRPAKHTRSPREPLWPVLATARTAEMIQADLTAAGVQWLGEDGKTVVDFHSLRNTFITNLALAGVVPKVAQQLARHSSIELTMNVYTKVGVMAERDAVNRLPAAPAITPAIAPGLTPPLTQHGRKLAGSGGQPRSLVNRFPASTRPSKPRKSGGKTTKRRKTRVKNDE